MNDYCNEQFLLVRYPNGAGGKFLISSLFLFDEIAHWCQKVQTQALGYMQWFDSAWPTQTHEWMRKEPNQPWRLDFFSRRLGRNNDLTVEDFNGLVAAEASDYFFECWSNGYTIVDHWHKRSVPQFFAKARWIEITLSDASLSTYKHLVKNKVFLHDPATNVIVSTMDHPDWAHDGKTKANIGRYNNAPQFDNFHDYDDFFYNYLLQQSWVNPFYQCTPDPHCLISLDLTQLIDKDGYLACMQTLSDHWNQTLDIDQLSRMHDIWIDRSKCSFSH